MCVQPNYSKYQEIAVVKAAKDRELSTLLLVADEVVNGSSYHLRIHQLTTLCQSQRCSHSWCQIWPEMLYSYHVIFVTTYMHQTQGNRQNYTTL